MHEPSIEEQAQKIMQRSKPLSEMNDSELLQAKIETQKAAESSRNAKLMTSTKLMDIIFPELEFLIPGILPAEGLAILASPPKIGKSWLALNIAIAAAKGQFVLGKYKMPRVKSLYFPLEDGKRRIQHRLREMGEANGAENLVLHFDELPTRPADYLREILDADPEMKLIVIDDTRSATPGNIDENGREFGKYWKPVQSLALEKSIMILMLFHTRKQAHDDFLQSLSGSTSFAGIADVLLVIKRQRGQHGATLHITGRDLEEQSLALEFDTIVKSFVITGNAADKAKTDERQEIVDLLKAKQPLKQRDIAERLNKNLNTIKTLLSRLVKEGKIENYRNIGYYLTSALNYGNADNYDNYDNSRQPPTTTTTLESCKGDEVDRVDGCTGTTCPECGEELQKDQACQCGGLGYF